jgi:hypothetical protein
MTTNASRMASIERHISLLTDSISRRQGLQLLGIQDSGTRKSCFKPTFTLQQNVQVQAEEHRTGKSFRKCGLFEIKKPKSFVFSKAERTEEQEEGSLALSEIMIKKVGWTQMRMRNMK